MLLEVKNIIKDYPIKAGLGGSIKKSVRAVDDVSLSIEEGESISLVGESGCGKTTLARIIMHLIKYNGGEIYYNSEKVTRKNVLGLRRRIQMVFQDPYNSLDPRYTARSIIKEGMELDKDTFKTEQVKELRCQQILEAVGLSRDMLGRYPHEFSGGERQRIAIARALVVNPKVLILDEAVSSLDVIVQDQILKLLKNLQKQFNLTYIFISHNLKVVKKISQRVAVMYQGKIVEVASTDEIFNNPLHEYTKDLLSAAVKYEVSQREEEIKINPSAQLVDRGHGHYVISS